MSSSDLPRFESPQEASLGLASVFLMLASSGLDYRTVGDEIWIFHRGMPEEDQRFEAFKVSIYNFDVKLGEFSIFNAKMDVLR